MIGIPNLSGSCHSKSDKLGYNHKSLEVTYRCFTRREDSGSHLIAVTSLPVSAHALCSIASVGLQIAVLLASQYASHLDLGRASYRTIHVKAYAVLMHSSNKQFPQHHTAAQPSLCSHKVTTIPIFRT